MNVSPAALQKSMLLVTQAKGLMQEKNYNGAVQVFQQAIRVCPSYSLAYLEFINMLNALREFENVLKVIQAVPADIYANSQPLKEKHCLALCSLGQHDKALAIFRAMSASTNIEKGLLHFNMGVCHFNLDNYDAALADLERSLALGYSSPELYAELATLYKLNNKIGEMGKIFDIALKKHTESIDIKYLYSLYMLANKSWETGFSYHKYRWHSKISKITKAAVPLAQWDGKSPICSLLVLPEQGVGDEILFSTFFKPLQNKAKKITIAADHRLIPLFQRTFPTFTFIDKDKEILFKEYDAHIYTADMGYHFSTAIGWKDGYLSVNKDQGQSIRKKYQAMFPGKKLIGLSWKSTRMDEFGRFRNIDLEHWSNVIKGKNCQFISLQYGNPTADIKYIKDILDIDIHVDPDVDCHNDLDAHAAQISALDLVITATNTTAHLAGATKKPVWIIAPIGPSLFWCWGLEGGTDFYPEARLFRAEKFGEWDSVLRALNEALEEFILH